MPLQWTYCSGCGGGICVFMFSLLVELALSQTNKSMILYFSTSTL